MILFMIIIIIVSFIVLFFLFQDQKKHISNTEKYTNSKYEYYKKPIMTSTEEYFYITLQKLENELQIKVQPQIPLSSILQRKNNDRTPMELYRVIDFGIFTSDYKKLLLLIEINDHTHKKANRRNRDIKVKNICKSAGIELVVFYTQYSNKEDYILNRIKSLILREKDK